MCGASHDPGIRNGFGACPIVWGRSKNALRAMTIEAAYQLRLDHEIGSVQFGKRADFCVLEADPLEIDPMELKDVPVWGTVFAGEPESCKVRVQGDGDTRFIRKEIADRSQVLRQNGTFHAFMETEIWPSQLERGCNGVRLTDRDGAAAPGIMTRLSPLKSSAINSGR